MNEGARLMTKKKVRLFLQHRMLNECLVILLARRYELTDNQPDVLVVDEPMLTPANIAAIQIKSPDIRVVVLGYGLDPTGSQLIGMVRAGAHAYVRVTSGSETLASVIDLVLEGNTIWPSEALEGFRLLPFHPQLVALPAPATIPPRVVIQGAAEPVPNFSPREAQLFEYIRAGLSNKHIAREANIAEATVKVHIKAILRKLRVQNRTQAAVWVANNYSERVTNLASPG